MYPECDFLRSTLTTCSWSELVQAVAAYHAAFDTCSYRAWHSPAGVVAACHAAFDTCYRAWQSRGVVTSSSCREWSCKHEWRCCRGVVTSSIRAWRCRGVVTSHGCNLKVVGNDTKQAPDTKCSTTLRCSTKKPTRRNEVTPL